LSFSAADSFFDRLKRFIAKTVALIGRYSPDQVVFEDVFLWQNIKIHAAVGAGARGGFGGGTQL
jgi:Holliday junction resolvasome RuvABC endonuclease subunit